ncbi:hypothetical protein DF043_36325 [Burkholderia cepacia]|nr:hypothetical protein DF043_36325 [Burkholderia cepacia]
MQVARCELKMHHERSAIAAPLYGDASSFDGSGYELDGDFHRHSIRWAAMAVHEKFVAESMLEGEPSKHRRSLKMLPREKSEDL